jgi:hypothetical protein
LNALQAHHKQRGQTDDEQADDVEPFDWMTGEVKRTDSIRGVPPRRYSSVDLDIS